ncbi:hypothetical protein MNBD_PLANCTO02-2643 [hydrothermal vent metagenome]|uniref:Uncharacterized protein n=1 Tax=hydrothermal vent metagenome TaxID=652676 RepID=A0A3B1E8V3_9ZZZZ
MFVSNSIRQSAKPTLLRKYNLDAIVRQLQIHAPLSRAELVRKTGMSYPTVMKICDRLIEEKLIETCDAKKHALGRPGNPLRMARDVSQIISISLGPDSYRVAVAGLDGTIIKERQLSLPKSYQKLLIDIESDVSRLKRERRARTVGLGVSIPGTLTTHSSTKLQTINSPNVPILNGKSLSQDISHCTKTHTVVSETMHCQLRAESIQGQAVDLDDYVILNYRGGLGLAVVSNGKKVTSSGSTGGEIGHIVIDPLGERCGCGNRGCLETLSTDIALLKAISRKLKRDVSLDEMIIMLQDSSHLFSKEIDFTLDYLAMSAGVTINLFRPQVLFLNGHFLEADPSLLKRLIDKIKLRSLKQFFQRCRISIAKSDTLQGAALAVVDQLINELHSEY